MNIKDKIKTIHESDFYGIFVETGQAGCISNALLREPGASKTVFSVEIPYSKYSQQEMFNVSGRSVSKETVSDFIHQSKNRIPKHNFHEKDKYINFVLGSSFQVGHLNDISTHGWIGIWTEKYGEIYYHISIHESMWRDSYLDEISKIGIRLLYNLVAGQGPNYIPKNCYVDIVNRDNDDLKTLLRFIDHSEYQCACIENGEAIRLEDILRKRDALIAYKGSFNPIHNGHVHHAKIAEEKYKTKPVFVISLDTFQKGHLDIDDIIKRVKMINASGYSVIVNKEGYFIDFVNLIRNKFDKQIIFPVGSDTINRLIESSYGNYVEDLLDTDGFVNAFKQDFKDVKFMVSFRNESDIDHKIIDHIPDDNIEILATPGVDFNEHYFTSSTSIRQLVKEGKMDEVEKLVPGEIIPYL